MDEIEAYIADTYPEARTKLIGFICGNKNSPVFANEIMYLLPTFNFASGETVDFFWLGSATNKYVFNDDVDLSRIRYKEEIRVRETRILEEKLGFSNLSLLSGVKLVIVPVYSKKIEYRNSILVDINELMNAKLPPEGPFFAVINYAKSMGLYNRQDMANRINSGEDVESLRDGIVNSMAEIAKSSVTDFISSNIGTVISGSVSILARIGS